MKKLCRFAPMSELTVEKNYFKLMKDLFLAQKCSNKELPLTKLMSEGRGGNYAPLNPPSQTHKFSNFASP